MVLHLFTRFASSDTSLEGHERQELDTDSFRRAYIQTIPRSFTLVIANESKYNQDTDFPQNGIPKCDGGQIHDDAFDSAGEYIVDWD